MNPPPARAQIQNLLAQAEPDQHRRDQLEEELLDMLPVLGREHIGKLVDSLEVAVGDRAEEAGVVDLAKDLAELL